MKNILIIFCLLFSISIFSQVKKVVKEDNSVPTSIFAANSLIYQTDKESMASLNLNYLNLWIMDFSDDSSFSNANRIKLDLRNFGRHITYEDLSDNFRRTEFNNYNVSVNSDHFIWSMWDTRIQKQWQQQLEKAKN
ncbi:hypothetical protein [Aureibaculum luteum]|uniref:hypothetical protein n=1 Tax=Aureibaculum luteum TaxID=1548456 RepID=UPI000E4E184D|nr:hypothetical protein [Aureibaculum luteum]